MRELLVARSRALAAPTFDAAGLYLAGVDYDAVWGLPPRERLQSPRLALEHAL
jgi:tRNA pseudouridine38-40 synthase